MEGIKFNKNYNNKLNCEFFTTIRPKKEKYKVGEFFIMSCPGIQDFMAEIISVSEYPNLASFSELELANDTGLDDYDKIVKLFESFYSNFDGPWYLIVLKRFDKKCVKCIECGSEDLEIHNCGYSSFNKGHVKCKKCDNTVSINLSWNDPDEFLIQAWNNRNDPRILIREKESQLRVITAEIEELRKKL